MNSLLIEKTLDDYDAAALVAKKAIENVEIIAVRLRRILGLVSTSVNQAPPVSDERIANILVKRKKRLIKNGQKKAAQPGRARERGIRSNKP